MSLEYQLLCNAVSEHNALCDSIFSACEEYMQEKMFHSNPRITIVLNEAHAWVATLCEESDIPTDLLEYNTFQLPIDEDGEIDEDAVYDMACKFISFEH